MLEDEQDKIITENDTPETDDISFSTDLDGDDSAGASPADLVAKIKKLKEKLKASDTERMEYLAGWQRAKADYVNLKKTEEKERQDLKQFAKTDLLLELIGLADSFDLAMANKETWNAVPENWRKGVEYIYQQLTGIFKNHGVSEINPVGELFDPLRAQSVAVIETDKPEDDHRVLAVVKKGYELSGTIIRPAHVKIGEKKET